MRVTNLAGVDLDTYRFDYDLTFVALLMNADGTIYHIYGGRTSADAASHLGLPSFARVLREGLKTHQAHTATPRTPQQTSRWTSRRPRTIEQLPVMRKRIELGDAPDCFHCHMVNDALDEEAREAGRWKRTMAWRWPDPIQIGLRLDGSEQTLVAGVLPKSAADAAGLKAGDRLQTLDGRRVLTFGDISRVLHEASDRATGIAVRWQRGGKERSATIRTRKGWKEPTPEVFAWRPTKWQMRPKPGFGGKQLTPRQLEQVGLPPDAFAFTVQYLVTWGSDAHIGRNAQRAGIRKGDVVYSVAGKNDFESVEHFHAWFRLTRKVGERIEIGLIRKNLRQSVRLEVVE